MGHGRTCRNAETMSKVFSSSARSLVTRINESHRKTAKSRADTKPICVDLKGVHLTRRTYGRKPSTVPAVHT